MDLVDARYEPASDYIGPPTHVWRFASRLPRILICTRFIVIVVFYGSGDATAQTSRWLELTSNEVHDTRQISRQMNCRSDGLLMAYSLMTGCCPCGH